MMEIKHKPDFEQAMDRVEAWFRHEPLRRPLVRFSEHNSDYAVVKKFAGRSWPTLKERWFDAEYQVDFFLDSIQGRQFLGETFPVYWPNLGPNVFAAFHGAELDYGEVTSWVQHCIHDWSDLDKLRYETSNVYFRKLEEMTRIALEKCDGESLVGYTDLHGSLDCVADWRDPQKLCVDLIESPDEVHRAVRLADSNFFSAYDHFDRLLKAHGQPSVTWMRIPARGRMHIPSCDFTSMISPRGFQEFYLPSLRAEVKNTTHNIFHLDGKGMLRHLDMILELPEIAAIQWVQGAGNSKPIMLWLDVIKKIQAAGKGVVVALEVEELEPFIAAMEPDGLYFCIAAPEAIQPDILKRLERWAAGKK